MAKTKKKQAQTSAAPEIHVSRNIILSQEMRLSMDTRKTRRNLNVLVIGGAGSGKSRFFVKPNLCEMPLNTSFVITDPAGELIIETGHLLESHGYTIKVFNLVDMSQTYHYNPLAYIKEENDIIMLVDCILKNTTDPNKTGGDDFWEKAEALMLRAFTALLWLHSDKLHLKCSVSTFLDLMRGCQVSEDDRTTSEQMCYTDALFDGIKKSGWYFDKDGNFHNGKCPDPDNLEHYDAIGEDVCTRYYDGFKQGAGKTLKSILISAIARLSALESDEIKKLFSQDDIELDKIGDRKTALFIIIPQEHDSFNFIAAMMYTQLFQSLYYHAENECKGNYLVCDQTGEVVKIFEVNHQHKEAEEIDYSKAVAVDLTKKGAVQSTSEEDTDKKKFGLFHKKEKPDIDFDASVQSAPDEETGTPPDTDPGEEDEDVEKKALDYIEKLNQLQAFQIDDLILLKIPDENGAIGPSEGEIVATYSDAEQARLKMEYLKHCSVKRCGLALPYHVTFLLDEFANIGQIPAFNKKLATMRKYEISCCIIIQAISQIKTMYKDDYETLIGNCDTMLFLGSSATDTLKYISEKLGKTTIDVRNHSSSNGKSHGNSLSFNKTARDLKTPDELALMPESDCIVMIRGVYPYWGKKHQFVNHRNYKYTMDADDNNKYIVRPPRIKDDREKISLGDLPSNQYKDVMEKNGLETIDLTQTSQEKYMNWKEKMAEIKAANAQEKLAKENKTATGELNAYNIDDISAVDFSSLTVYPSTPEIEDLIQEVVESSPDLNMDNDNHQNESDFNKESSFVNAFDNQKFPEMPDDEDDEVDFDESE